MLFFGADINHTSATSTPQVYSEEQILKNEIVRLSDKYGVSKELATKIIRCESKNKPFAKGHNRGKDGIVWSTDHSYWQLNDYYWKEKMMVEFGWDITIPPENLEAGFWLLSTEGTQPWKASENCWKYGTSNGYNY